MSILLTKFQNQLLINREIIDVYHAKDSIEHNLFYLDDQSLCLQFHSNSLTSSQTHLSLFTKNTSDETDVSRNIKIFRKLHELELSRKSRYQTINFKIRVQRWQWRHQLILETTIHRDIIYLRNRIYETNFNRKKTIWLRNLMIQLTCDVEYSQTMMIYEDNQSAIVLIKNSQFHARIKHIDIQTHFIREKVIEEFIDLIYVSIDQMIIDHLTKSLIKNKFVQFRVVLKIE
jgi:hypothetical protein